MSNGACVLCGGSVDCGRCHDCGYTMAEAARSAPADNSAGDERPGVRVNGWRKGRDCWEPILKQQRS